MIWEILEGSPREEMLEGDSCGDDEHPRAIKDDARICIILDCCRCSRAAFKSYHRFCVGMLFEMEVLPIQNALQPLPWNMRGVSSSRWTSRNWASTTRSWSLTPLFLATKQKTTTPSLNGFSGGFDYDFQKKLMSFDKSCFEKIQSVIKSPQSPV